MSIIYALYYALRSHSFNSLKSISFLLPRPRQLFAHASFFACFIQKPKPHSLTSISIHTHHHTQLYTHSTMLSNKRKRPPPPAGERPVPSPPSSSQRTVPRGSTFSAFIVFISTLLASACFTPFLLHYRIQRGKTSRLSLFAILLEDAIVYTLFLDFLLRRSRSTSTSTSTSACVEAVLEGRGQRTGVGEDGHLEEGRRRAGCHGWTSHTWAFTYTRIFSSPSMI